MKAVKEMMLVGILTMAGTARAERVVCQARIPPSICGSGQVKVSLDPDNNTYELIADVGACWTGANRVTLGNIEKLGAGGGNFRFSTVYALKVASRPEQTLATLVIGSPRLPLGDLDVVPALLDFAHKRRGGTTRSSFNLICNNVSDAEGHLGW